MAARVNRDRLRATYDRLAPGYDRSVGFGERLLLGDLRRAYGAELRGETLEVAIGSGLNLPHYPAAVTRAVGADLSGGMLRQARGRAAALGRAIALVQADAERLPFPAASFDTVGVSLALCTVPDPVAALGEVARVCRPDGRVVLLEHVRSPVAPVAALERLLSPLQERYIGCHLTRETVDTLREEGFTVVSEQTRLAGVFRLVVARLPTGVGAP
jgi:ubiquinone/menaquinone biosynthesis C-methylase UbiE